jgi:hypothetical protein
MWFSPALGFHVKHWCIVLIGSRGWGKNMHREEFQSVFVKRKEVTKARCLIINKSIL